MAETETNQYIPGLGRRKRSIAQVRLIAGGSGKITVNDKPLAEYLPVETSQLSVMSPLRETGTLDTFDITVKVTGGGMTGQADAIRLGISRALIIFNPDFRPALKKLGLLTRDAREKERKKPGLKGARRAPQWSKR